MGLTSCTISWPHSWQVWLVTFFLLKREQLKLGDRVGCKLYVEKADVRRNMIDILPDSIIEIGCHRLVEMNTAHGLHGIDDILEVKAESGCSFRCSHCDIEFFYSRTRVLESIEIIRGLSLLHCQYT